MEEKTYGQICEFGSGFVYEGRIRLGSEYSDPGQSLIDIEREFFFRSNPAVTAFSRIRLLLGFDLDLVGVFFFWIRTFLTRVCMQTPLLRLLIECIAWILYKMVDL